MAAPRGHKKWGGRKKGTVNKDKQTLLELANDLGISPFEVMLYFAAGNYHALRLTPADITPQMRLNAAVSAAKYLYPQKKAIEHSGEVNVQLLERYRELEALPDEELKKIAGR